jgi:hypothetical protein
MKAKFFFSVIVLSLVATCSLINFNFSENANFENYALGTQTITYWAKGTDKSIIHISAIDSSNSVQLNNGWQARGKKDVLLVLGNSQGHSINQKKEDEVTFVELLHSSIKSSDVLANTYPNASLQDFMISYFYWRSKLPVKAVLIPIFMDDLREENGVKDDFYPLLIEEKFRFPEGNNNVFKSLNDDFKFVSETRINKKESEISGFETTQEKVEFFLNSYFDDHFSAWNNRKNVSSAIFSSLYELRNTVFNIKATTVRRMIPNRYNDNLKALDLIIADAKKSDVTIYLYIPPIRNDVQKPYDSIEYEKLKSYLTELPGKHPGRVFLKDFDNIVPGKFFGAKKSTKLGKDELELDFMHFQYAGHKILSDSLYQFLSTTNLK